MLVARAQARGGRRARPADRRPSRPQLAQPPRPTLADLREGAQAHYKANYATVARLGKAVPADDDVRSLLVQLDAAAKRTRRRLPHDRRRQRRRRRRRPTRRPRPRAAARRPGRVAVGTAGFSAMPFTFTFKGSFFDARRLLHAARALRHGQATSSIDVTGRLLRLESITLTPTRRRASRAHAPRSARAPTSLPPTEGLTAGATAAGARRHHGRRARRAGRRRHRRRPPRPRPSLEPPDERSSPTPGASSCSAGCGRCRSCWSPRSSPCPMLLAKDPAPAPAAGAAPPPAADDGRRARRSRSSTSAADGDRSGSAAACSARRKDPFKPERRRPKAEATPKAPPTRRAHGTARRPAATGRRRRRPRGGPAARRRPRRRRPAPRRRPSRSEYELYSLTVRFGDADGATARRKRRSSACRPLPVRRRPRARSTSALEDRQDRGVPGRLGRRRRGRRHLQADARRLRDDPLHEGETEFFDVTDGDGDGRAQYELDVVKIHKTTTASATKAEGRTVAPSGRMILRARIAGDGPLRYRYDAQDGRLPKLRTRPTGRRRQGRARRAATSGPPRAPSSVPPRLPGVPLRVDHRRGVPRPRPDLHRRGPARRASSSTARRSTATWRAASSATAAAGA